MLSVSLRPIHQEDLPLVCAWMNHPTVGRMMGFLHPIPLQNWEKWYRQMRETASDSAFVIQTLDGAVIGFCSISKIDWKERVGIVQIIIGDVGQHGKGYGREAVQLLLYHAWHDLKLVRLRAWAFTDNAPSLALCRQFARPEGIEKYGQYREGKLEDIYWFSAYPEDFDSKPQAA
jgi:RimJ/RimL family protein N-acetyltransferase